MASDLIKKINSDLVEALKSKNVLKTDTLRFLLSSVHNREIEKRTKTGKSELDESEVVEVLGREAKKRKEAAGLFERGGRRELAEKELAELKIIKDYLPEELSEAEILKVVREAVDSIKPQSVKDMGRVMGEAMKQLKGRAESGLVSRLVKEALEKL